MHLLIKSSVSGSDANDPPGTMSLNSVPFGATLVEPGRLVQLLDLLAQDQTSQGDGHGPFNITAAAGASIETTGEFTFAFQGRDHDAELDECEAAVARLGEAFPSRIVERIHAELTNEPGALRDYVAGLADQGLLIDEIVIGVARGGDATGQGAIVPIAVHAIRQKA